MVRVLYLSYSFMERKQSESESEVTPVLLTEHHFMEVWLHAFSTSALNGGEWSASRPGRFTPRERTPGTHWIGGWVRPQSRSGRRGEEINS
jgi:hypothetical protein